MGPDGKMVLDNEAASRAHIALTTRQPLLDNVLEHSSYDYARKKLDYSSRPDASNSAIKPSIFSKTPAKAGLLPSFFRANTTNKSRSFSSASNAGLGFMSPVNNMSAINLELSED